jgi:glycosyltransferase involved in cell wall biosynthesis
LPVDAKVIAILAALRPEKNHAMFLAGAAEILGQEPTAKFLVIGDGPLRDPLVQQANQLGVAQATQFLGSRHDVDRVLQAVDVLALTSHNEASPVSILEGLSCGVPCVASNVGSVSETVIDNVMGKLFPAGDQTGYVRAVLELLGNEPLRAQMGAAGRQQVIEQRSLDSMVRGYEMLIERLYSAKSSKSLDVKKKTGLSTAPWGAPS